MTAEALALGLANTLLHGAAKGVAARLAERVVGSSKERAFRASLRSTVDRFIELYPAAGDINVDTDFFLNPDVVTGLFDLAMTDDSDQLTHLAEAFRRAYDEVAVFGVRAELALARLVGILEEELSETGFLAERRDLKYLRRISKQLERIGGAAEGPLSPEQALNEFKRIHERLALPPLGNDVSARIVVDQDIARLTFVPQPGRSLPIEGRVVFAFPNDADGIAAQNALKQAIERGGDVAIPRRFISQFELRIGDRPLPGTEELPELVTLRAAPPNPFASRLLLYRAGKLLAAIDVPHLLRVRAGTKEVVFETQRGRALDARIILETPPAARASGTFEIHFDRVRDALEGWPLMQFLLCGSVADRMVWQRLDDGARLSLRTATRPAPPEVSVRYVAHLRALASIQEATGTVLPWPWEGVTRPALRRALRVARALRAGVRTHIFSELAVELNEEIPIASILEHANDLGEVSLNVLELEHWVVVAGQRLDLGPVFQWLPTVKVTTEGRSLRIAPGSDRRAFEIFVRFSDLEELERPRQRLVIFSEPGGYPLRMMGLRKRQA